MGLHRGTVASSIASVPGAVTSLNLSASDRTITATWSAPTNNGGLPVTSYTVETQRNSEGWVSQGSQSSGVSFTVRNNSAATARSYKVRVTANNAMGSGPSTESGSATPNFGTPATPTLSMRAGYPSSAQANFRPFNISYTPLNCSAFSSAQIWVALIGYGYSNDANSAPMSTTSTTAQVFGLDTLYSPSWGFYRQPQPSETYYAFIRTFNSDGDYVDSAAGSFTTAAAVAFNYYTEAAGTYTSSQVAVNSNTYSITSAYVGGPDRRTDSLRVYARSTTGTSTICTSSRNFSIAFSYATTGTYTNQSQLTPPFSNNSGTTFQNRLTGFAQGYGGAANSARIQIRGAGSIASGWNPTITVYFVVGYTDRTLQTGYY